MKAGKENKATGTKEVELTGKVVKKTFGKGSKSDHEAVYIETEKGDYRLRRKGGNPFHDPVLQKLIGKEITATGIINEYNFIARQVKESR